MLVRLARNGIPQAPTDHVFSKATYVHDPDGLMLELTLETPERYGSVEISERNVVLLDSDGRRHAGTEPLDVPAALAPLGDADPGNRMPDGTYVGHLHLHVGDLRGAHDYYRDVIGFEEHTYMAPIRMADLGAGALPAPDRAQRLERTAGPPGAGGYRRPASLRARPRRPRGARETRAARRWSRTRSGAVAHRPGRQPARRHGGVSVNRRPPASNSADRAAAVAARAVHMMGATAQHALSAEQAIAWEGLLEVSRRMGRGAEEVLLERHELSISMLGITGRLAIAGERTLRQTALADAMGLSLSRVSRVIDLLAERGLVERRPCPSDARATNVTLTDRGAALTAGAQADLLAFVRGSFLGELEPAEVRNLAAAFTRLINDAN